MKGAIIGGTGVYGITKHIESKELRTPYGVVEVEIANVDGKEVVFLPRHGKHHQTPPHQINYHGNMYALSMLGVTHILATCAVGSMNPDFMPGDIIVVNDFIDMTQGRSQTFYENNNGVAHVDMSDPYCKTLRENIYDYFRHEGVIIKGEGVYVCTEGPRFETASEIRMYRMMGSDIVGMTNVPEVVLAKELGMCYAAVGIVTNWCTGMKDTIVGHEIEAIMANNKQAITESYLKILTGHLTQEDCKCNDALIKL